MPFDTRLFHSKSRVPLEKLVKVKSKLLLVMILDTHSTDKTLRVLGEHSVVRELQLVL